MPRYRIGNESGGYLILDTQTGWTVFIQPGDDAATFWAQLEATNEMYDDDDVCSEYFYPAPEA